MCGIAGIWERSGAPVDAAALERMTRLLRHRGPDGTDAWVNGEIGLANTRLSIIDLSRAGAQPMGLPERDLWLTYNGEIHNYIELRRELEARGAVFRTKTDTEVVLHSYAEWGFDCFERFNGMWALAIWDGRERRLVLCRDRFGIKPLCYSIRDGRVCFASEPKAILAAFPQERKPDFAEINSFLKGGDPDAGERTFFANVKNAPPGSCLVIATGETHGKRYWRFNPGSETPTPDVEARFRTLLEDAVRLRMRSDVPVGLSLSGGLDSSAIAGLVDGRTNEALHCFSLRYDGFRHDESSYAAAAARGRPFRLHWVRTEPEDLLATVRSIVWHHDAPSRMRGRLGTWFVMQEAAEHVKVVLVGEGGDEILAGYAQFVLPYLVDRVRRAPPPTASRPLLRDVFDLSEIESAHRLWFLARAPLPAVRHALGLERWGRSKVVRADFGAEFGPAETGRETPYRSALNNALWNEFRRDGLPEILHGGDALSMAFSIETRTPFLDHRLVEFCFSLPYYEKINGGWTKSVLRRALADVLPAEIRTRRRKVGFSSPVEEWLLRDLSKVRQLLLDRGCLERGIFEPRELELVLSRFERGPALYRTHRIGRLWAWTTLELWFRDFIDASP